MQHFVEWLRAFGLLGILLIAMLDSMGVPLPAVLDTLLITLAIETPEHAYIAAALATLGSLGGNMFLFRAARMGGRRFLREEAPESRRHKFQRWFHRYGLLTVFIPAVTPFAPLPLKVFVLSAGAIGTPFVRFLAVILSARIIRYFGVAYVGVVLGHNAVGFLSHNRWVITGVLFAIAIALVFAIRWQERRGIPLTPESH